jgi:hypothetical protein
MTYKNRKIKKKKEEFGFYKFNYKKKRNTSNTMASPRATVRPSFFVHLNLLRILFRVEGFFFILKETKALTEIFPL